VIDHALNLDMAHRRALRLMLESAERAGRPIDAAIVRADLAVCERRIQERLTG
jgi:hypothetical protein